MRKVARIPVHDRGPRLCAHFDDQRLFELSLDGRREKFALPGSGSCHAESAPEVGFRFLDPCRIICNRERNQTFFQSAAEVEIRPHAGIEVLNVAGPDLDARVWSSPTSTHRRSLGMAARYEHNEQKGR